MPYFYPQYNNPYQAPSGAQMTPINPGIPGKVVNNFQEITIGDIPTNGSIAFFIKNDLSEIQTRKWSDDGRVLVGSFRPENSPVVNLSPEPKQEQNEAVPLLTEDIMKRFDEIEKRLDQLIPKTTGKVTKKENEST